MDGECSRSPARISRVTALAIRANPDRSVWRVGCVVVIGKVATHTGIRGIRIIPVVA